MAFFVSKDLEGRVDENSLIEAEDRHDSLKEFVFEIDEISCQITKIKFFNNNDHDYAEIECECNIHAVDQLAFSSNTGIVFFKNKSIEVHTLKIVKILKKDSDNYTISVNGIIPRGKINV